MNIPLVDIDAESVLVEVQRLWYDGAGDIDHLSLVHGESCVTRAVPQLKTIILRFHVVGVVARRAVAPA